MPKKPDTKTAEELAHDAAYEPLGDYEEYVAGRALRIWSYSDTGHNLSVEEQLFCRSYIIDRNPVAALVRLNHNASPAILKRRAAKMLANPEVQGCVEHLAKEMMDKLEITAERVQRKIAEIAFFDPRRVMEFDALGVKLLHSRFWSEADATSIQSVKMGANGIELKLYDRTKALEMLSKQLGVQPDDTDAAEAVRIGADSAMSKILTFFNRMLPDDDPEMPSLPN